MRWRRSGTEAMHIVLDTNIIISDPRLQGTTFRSLLEEAEAAGAQLCIPRPVLDEAQEHFERSLREAANQLRRAIEKVARLLEQDLDSPLAIDDFSAEAAKYRRWVEKTI